MPRSLRSKINVNEADALHRSLLERACGVHMPLVCTLAWCDCGCVRLHVLCVAATSNDLSSASRGEGDISKFTRSANVPPDMSACECSVSPSPTAPLVNSTASMPDSTARRRRQRPWMPPPTMTSGSEGSGVLSDAMCTRAGAVGRVRFFKPGFDFSNGFLSGRHAAPPLRPRTESVRGARSCRLRLWSLQARLHSFVMRHLTRAHNSAKAATAKLLYSWRTIDYAWVSPAQRALVRGPLLHDQCHLVPRSLKRAVRCQRPLHSREQRPHRYAKCDIISRRARNVM